MKDRKMENQGVVDTRLHRTAASHCLKASHVQGRLSRLPTGCRVP
jgi:hypothetical protein